MVLSRELHQIKIKVKSHLGTKSHLPNSNAGGMTMRLMNLHLQNLLAQEIHLTKLLTNGLQKKLKKNDKLRLGAKPKLSSRTFLSRIHLQVKKERSQQLTNLQLHLTNLKKLQLFRIGRLSTLVARSGPFDRTAYRT
jgi:hypothetical protein